ncbi:MAG: PDZ domain-containing protein [Acidobacteria bacterium]|nr:PDZ domain-containing protein [Acidobacteriota bacterium]
MTPEPQRAETFAGNHTETVFCPGCSARMLRGMRFCRSCGFRLGEGLDEYVETTRLEGLPFMSATSAAGRTMRVASAQTTNLAPQATAGGLRRRRSRRACGGGMGWIGWIAIVALFCVMMSGGVVMIGGAGRGVARAVRVPLTPRSFVGTQDFDYVRGEGVMLEGVLPGSPAERAGLLDGDEIQRFDGVTVKSEEGMRDLLRRTPAGKTVEVNFLRDGAPMTTALTTVGSGDYDEKSFMPPGGAAGYWGVDDLERVVVNSSEGAGVRGVQLGNVRANRPADIAGLKAGDIVTEFDGKPVRTPDGLATYIHHATPASTIKIAVFRDGQRLELPVKMGRDN